MKNRINDTTTRKMTENDIDAVMKVEEMSFSTPWSKEAFTLEINKNHLAKYIVAVKDDEIVGYGGMWLIVDEGHITNIAVHPNYRGQGIGNLIVEGLIEICKVKNIYRMTLEVRKSNHVAQALYKKYDFSECGIRPRYYSDTNEDAVIMWKELAE